MTGVSSASCAAVPRTAQLTRAAQREGALRGRHGRCTGRWAPAHPFRWTSGTRSTQRAGVTSGVSFPRVTFRSRWRRSFLDPLRRKRHLTAMYLGFGLLWTADGVLDLLRSGHTDDLVFGWLFTVLGVLYLGLGVVGLRVRPRAPQRRHLRGPSDS